MVAGALRTTNTTVGYWWRRFSQGGAESLWDEPRPGAPRQIGDEKVQQIIELTLQAKPKAATHWSTRLMTQKLGLSQSAISRIWRLWAQTPSARDLSDFH
jgi:transposase